MCTLSHVFEQMLVAVVNWAKGTVMSCKVIFSLPLLMILFILLVILLSMEKKGKPQRGFL